MKEENQIFSLPLAGLKFKGSRDYLHGTDIQGAALNCVSIEYPSSVITDILSGYILSGFWPTEINKVTSGVFRRVENIRVFLIEDRIDFFPVFITPRLGREVIKKNKGHCGRRSPVWLYAKLQSSVSRISSDVVDPWESTIQVFLGPLSACKFDDKRYSLIKIGSFFMEWIQKDHSVPGLCKQLIQKARSFMHRDVLRYMARNDVIE